MKKIILFFFSLLIVTQAAFAERLIIENQTAFPKKNQKFAIQWAHSGQEVQEGNSAMIEGSKLDSSNLQFIHKSGKIDLHIPDQAEYFRVVIWSKQNEENPDLLTNWVEVTPNKTYTLKSDHLVPSVLMLGSGC